MKGLSLEQFTQVVEFAQKHHHFAMYISEKEKLQRKKDFPLMPDSYGFGIKYIDSTYDSRDKTIWAITFRQGSWGVRFATNHYNGLKPQPKQWKYDNLFDWCMAYLKGEFKVTDEFMIDRK